MRYRIFFVAIMFGLFGCRHNANIPDTPIMSFQKDVQPIILANCTSPGCHGAVDSKGEKLETYEEVMNLVSSG